MLRSSELKVTASNKLNKFHLRSKYVYSANEDSNRWYATPCILCCLDHYRKFRLCPDPLSNVCCNWFDQLDGRVRWRLCCLPSDRQREEYLHNNRRIFRPSVPDTSRGFKSGIQSLLDWKGHDRKRVLLGETEGIFLLWKHSKRCVTKQNVIHSY